jgi:predicted hydrocarbon binding protein
MSVHVSDHYYDPEKHYCGIYIVSKLSLPEFGPTSELIKIFDKRGIVLLSITSHQYDGVVYDFIIVDLTGKENIKTDLEKEIRDKFGEKLVYLQCAETGIPGFIYNVNGFPLVFNFSNNYTPVAALTAPVWKTLIMGMIKRFGTGASIILWYMGNDAGEGKGKLLLPLKGISNKDMVKMGLARLQSLGWGRFDLIECDEQGKTVIIRVHDNFEEMVTKELLDYQNSFLKGFLVGLVSIIFGKGCRAMETMCVNKGDPYCEFTLL